MIREYLIKHWYNPNLTPITCCLLPFSWVFRFIVYVRRFFYRHLYRRLSIRIPVVVIGNLTVGGTGKTPLVMELANLLKKKGYRPGIISRGVGGKMPRNPHLVLPEDVTQVVGDEALLLARTGCPTIVCRNRAKAAKALSDKGCNVILSDDGLQHYQLKRNIEIIMVDGLKKFGNQQLLPAGPLREPIKRAHETDFILHMMGNKNDQVCQMQPIDFVSLINPQERIPFNQFANKRIHAVAGLGNPERFFYMLEKEGFKLIRHTFPDHHHYSAKDIHFFDALPVIMTEKDAVKCQSFASERCWYLKISIQLPKLFIDQFFKRLQQGDSHAH